MATIKEIKELALHAARGTAPANYSNENVNVALREEMKNLASSVNEFMRNRYDIYDIIISTADEVVPNKVISALGMFADIQQVGQGEKAMFRTSLGKARAKKFITRVGLSGVYETFRLDKGIFEVSADAVGGAATIDFERFLDGAEDMADVMDVITEGLSDAIFGQVQRALKAAVSAAARPSANLVSKNTFVPADMLKLINIARAYSSSAVIFAPPEFVAAMGPDAIVPVGTYGTSYPAVGVYHPQDIDAIHNTGYINLFRGTPVVQIPQSFTDIDNQYTEIDPQLAYVLPAGKEKVVKVVLEGATQIHDFTNRDNSMEIHAYKKMGCAILTHYNWCIYQNTGITQTYQG